MNRTILRSIAAILVGWLVVVGGCVVTLTAIALFNPEAFKPAVHHSVGYWLVTLSVGAIYSVVGGFITGIIARRREIAHAIGLVVFGLLISKCLPRGHADTMSVPNWYWIAGYVLGALSTIWGGWLRMKQRILLDRGSEAVIKATDNLRFGMAAIISFVAFLLVLSLGTAAGGAGLWWVEHLLSGEDTHTPPSLLPIFIVSLILASILARRVFKRIIGVRASPLSDGVADDRVES